VTDKDELGRLGEAAAAKLLKREGYRIIERNVSNAYGEIDIVAVEGASRWSGEKGELAFVEVKTRTDDGMGAPEEAVTRPKQAHIIRAALAYVQAKGLDDYPMRFDVVGVEFDERGRPVCNLIRAAFTAEDGGW